MSFLAWMTYLKSHCKLTTPLQNHICKQSEVDFCPAAYVLLNSALQLKVANWCLAVSFRIVFFRYLRQILQLLKQPSSVRSSHFYYHVCQHDNLVLKYCAVIECNVQKSAECFSTLFHRIQSLLKTFYISAGNNLSNARGCCFWMHFYLKEIWKVNVIT